MASNHTQHYGLCQWEATDAVLRTDFNEDNQKIDTALKTQAGNFSDLTAQMANKANTGVVNNLAEEVAQKADQSDLEAAVGRVTTLENKHSSDVATLRSENCWVKLSDETLSNSVESYSYTIENPEQYAELKCMFSVTSSDGQVNLSVNHGATIYTDMNGNGVEDVLLLSYATKGIGGALRIFPMATEQYIAVESHTAGANSENKAVAVTDTVSLQGTRFSQLQSVTISSDRGKLKSGGRFILYGMKK